MADRFRLVYFTRPGRDPELALDMEDDTTYFGTRDTFTITPPGKRSNVAMQDTRYAGGRTVGEAHDNGAIAKTLRVKGATPQACLDALEAIHEESESFYSPQKYVEWRPDGAPRSVYYELRGTATITSRYAWAQFAQGYSLEAEVSFPVAPLARWDEMDVDISNWVAVTDWTFLSGASASVSFAEADLVFASGANVALVHTARGYQYEDVQAALTFVVPSSSRPKVGVILRYNTDSSHIEVYVDDTGTNSRLRIDEVSADRTTRTNLASTNLPSRLTLDAQYTIQGRTEGFTTYAEIFTAGIPTPMESALASTSAALVGVLEGTAGMVVSTPTQALYASRWKVDPYTYKNRTLPEALTLEGAIPGSAPAEGSMVITHSGGAAAPAFALIGWGAVNASPRHITVEEAENYVAESGTVAVSGNAAFRGSAGRRVVTSGAGSAYVEIQVAAASASRDHFSDETVIEVWGRIEIASTVASPVMTLSSLSSLGVGTRRYSGEYGTSGKTITKPSSGTVFRFVRLGTLSLPTGEWETNVRVAWSWATGSTGNFGLDYVTIVPAATRMVSPSGKAQDATYPAFLSTTSERLRHIAADGSGSTATTTTMSYPQPDVGLGGAPLDIPIGGDSTVLVVKLSSLVPDDPTSNANTEQLAHSGTVHLAVTPRSFVARGG